MVWKVLGLVVEGFEVVVGGRFGQFEMLKNACLFLGQAGALGEGASAGVVGAELDAVEFGGEVA